jgi:hypothetical protein
MKNKIRMAALLLVPLMSVLRCHTQPQARFSLKLHMNGLLALVPMGPQAMPTDAWVLWVNATMDPPQNDAKLLPHLAALGLAAENLEPVPVIGTGKEYVTIPFYTEDLSISANCTGAPFGMGNHEVVPQMMNFAGQAAMVDKTYFGNSQYVDEDNVLARFHVQQGVFNFAPVLVDQYGKTISWCIDNVAPTQVDGTFVCNGYPQKQIAEAADLMLTCKGRSATLTLTQFKKDPYTNKVPTREFTIYPSRNSKRVEVDLMNLMPGDLRDPQHPSGRQLLNELHHFDWFYKLSFQKPDKYRTPFWLGFTPHDGKPYCTFAEMTPSS